jgi:MYXO-CTERM domain-containing protein
VVGYSNAGGWIWSASSGTQLLNNLVPSGWVISGAIGISQNGLILAQGSFNGGASQYVELVPVVPTTPAPSTGFLALGGLLLVFAWRIASNRGGDLCR